MSDRPMMWACEECRKPWSAKQTMPGEPERCSTCGNQTRVERGPMTGAKMTDRPTPGEIARKWGDDGWCALQDIEQHGYVIVSIDAMRHWWDYGEDAVDAYSLMNWIESQ